MAKDGEIPAIGHNSGTAVTAEAGKEIKAFIERVERLEEEKAGIAGDIKEVFAEAKGRGYDAKVIRHLIRLRKQDHAERQEFEALIDLYASAIGMGNVFA